ncbi:MAG: hypothetical protein ACLFVC_03500 [Opitutales bacterium]
MDVESLRDDLEYITQSRPLPEGGSMAEVLRRLDRAACAGDLPARLEHYLTRRSYVKALDWLDHPETPHRA